MKRLLALALLTLAASACGTLARHGTAGTTTATPSINPLDLYARTKEDFRQVGIIAAAGNDAIGVQCSADTAKLFAIVDRIGETTGYFFADIETRRVAEASSLFALAHKAADSCAPLLIGLDKYFAVLHLPGNVAKLLNGGGQ